MTKKVLFGNNISKISTKLPKYLKSLDFSVTRCENKKETIFEMLKNGDYDVLIFFSVSKNMENRIFIENIRAHFPNLKVYCLFYFYDECNKISRICNGADKCFTTSDLTNDVCFDIITNLIDEKEVKFSFEIAEFLVKLKLPCYMNCFYIVCVSLQKLIEDPNYFKNFSKNLYPFLEKELNVSSYWAERGIRYMSNFIYKNGVRFESCDENSVPDNKDFLKALVCEYQKYKKETVRKEH